jgi:hypothetical protein
MAVQLNCTGRERAKLIQNTNFNGIDYLEVIEPQDAGDIPLLVVFCFKAVSASDLDKIVVHIDGGVRIKNIGVLWAQTYPVTSGFTISQYESKQLQEMDISQQAGNVLVIRPTSDGDFSTYTLRLVNLSAPDSPPDNFDQILSHIDFSFKVDCPTAFDCMQQTICPPEIFQEPVIDYMAKDYESFRQLMLDKLALTIPDWKDTNPLQAADMGIALVELLAYVGDQLSYYQDAVATEAYLDTARKRISIRRHARLLDYLIHDGCNARAWVSITVDQGSDGLLVPGPQPLSQGGRTAGTKLLTGGDGDTTVVKEKDLDTASVGAMVFETMHDLTVYNALNQVDFYTWGEPQCCLPKGATIATLSNENNALDFPVFRWENVPGSDSEALKKFLINTYGQPMQWISNLDFTPVDTSDLKQRTINDGVNSLSITLDVSRAAVDLNNNQLDEFVVAEPGNTQSTQLSAHLLRIGDVLILEEARSPLSGKEADADPSHRQVVRLTAVTADKDNLTTPTPTSVLTISWSIDDALSFPLCLWDVMDPDMNQLEPVSIAHGNVVLADHGNTSFNGDLSDYNQGEYDGYTSFTEFLGNVPPVEPFRPILSYLPLTFTAPFDAYAAKTLPASLAFSYDPRDAIPSIVILGEDDIWLPQRDLLSSDQFATDFVVEVDNDTTPNIRFGDGQELGMKPTGSSDNNPNPYFAVYRVGNGRQGNVGREAISRIVNSATFSAQGIQNIRNPIEAQGGVDPEDMEDVRQFAPQAFRTQERAVTMDDYAEILETYPGVQKALAVLRWTGSWYTVFVAVDRLGGLAVDNAFKKVVRQFLNNYRLAVYDLEIQEPLYVPLDILINVCMAPNYLWGDVEKALLDAFSNRVLPDGTKGFFYPDNFTFGDPVYISRIIDTAMKVPGVSSIIVERFQRLTGTENGELAKGEIDMAPSEIARLDNDPNFPENGQIAFSQEVGS